MEKKVVFESNSSFHVEVPKIRCPLHGEHDAYMTMMFRNPYKETRYCMYCIQDMLVEGGVYHEQP